MAAVFVPDENEVSKVTILNNANGKINKARYYKVSPSFKKKYIILDKKQELNYKLTYIDVSNPENVVERELGGHFLTNFTFSIQ